MQRTLGLAALAMFLAQSVWGAPPPIEAFAKRSPVSSPALAPGGRLLAWHDNSSEPSAVVVFDLAAARPVRSFPISDSNPLSGFEWADDGTLLLTLLVSDRYPTGTYTLYRVMALNVVTGVSRVLLSDDVDRSAAVRPVVLAHRTAKPHLVTMASWDYKRSAARPQPTGRTRVRRGDTAWVYSTYAVDTRSGAVTVLEHGTQFTSEWIVDSDGMPVVRSEWDPTRRRYEVLAKAGGAWKSIHVEERAEPMRLWALSPDGTAVVATGARGGAWQKAWAIPLDGSGVSVLVEENGVDASSVWIDELTNRALGVQLEGARPSVRWIDEKRRMLQQTLERSFPGLEVRRLDRSADSERALVAVFGASVPWTYYLVDFHTGKADIVGESHPGLANLKLAEVRVITYRARDGEAITAYLTLPQGTGEQHLPLVVLPHDGPEGRDLPEFDWFAQFLASRGYAVLQPQFRGSAGFGEAHRLAGRRQWGGVVLNDITDGVKALVAQQLADPKRICAVGFGFGGYAALAGAAFTPELYACVVSIDGWSDLPAFLRYIDNRGLPDSDSKVYWTQQLGDLRDPMAAAWSPARAAFAVRAPVLLIHSADNPTQPLEQAEKMHDALRSHERAVKFLKLTGDHAFARDETRIRVGGELEAFLREHLGSP